MQLFLASLLLLIFHATASESSCEERSELKDTISHSYTVYGGGSYRKCWKILNPSRQLVTLKKDYLHFNAKSCDYVNITVTVNNKVYRLCGDGHYEDDVIIGNTDVLIKFTVYKNMIRDGNVFTLQLSYEMDDTNIPQVREARLRLIDWLTNKRNPSWGWKEDTARAIIALYLGDGATFNGTNLHEELMAKQLEVRTAIALLGQPIANERLSMFINALLVSCRNPYNFYGQNLVNLLKEQVTSTRNFTHPIAYLTLCNANVTLPSKAFEDLSDILNSEHKFPFIKDFQAIAVMALSCYRNKSNSLNELFENGTLTLDYERTVQELKKHQLTDGSFGNVHTTALISQALISSGLVNATSWYSGAVEYLIKELNSSSVDFSAVTLSLPVLNGKSFADIGKVNCSSSRRHEEDELVSDIDDYSGPKMRIQYSLYKGDDKDVVHTISLKVPENSTAYSVMKLAESEDPKYNFEFKRINTDLYIYRIGNLSNDPENGKFWLQYLKSGNATSPTDALTAPDHLVLEDGDHLIMWYRRPSM